MTFSNPPTLLKYGKFHTFLFFNPSLIESVRLENINQFFNTRTHKINSMISNRQSQEQSYLGIERWIQH